MHFLSKFGSPNFSRWWLIALTSSKCAKFLFLSSFWPWRVSSINPQNLKAKTGILLLIHALASTMVNYSNIIMGAMASQITSLAIVYSTAYWGANQRKHQNSASLAFVQGIHRWPVNSPHKWPVTREVFPFDDVIMFSKTAVEILGHGWIMSSFIGKLGFYYLPMPYSYLVSVNERCPSPSNTRSNHD